MKIIGAISVLALFVLIILFYRFSTPKSDQKIAEEFNELGIDISISYQQFKDFKYRVIKPQKEIDTTLTTIVFIHGSIGSAMDFKKYLSDSALNIRANLIAYDRIGYGVNQTGDVQESIAFEVEMVEEAIGNINKKNTILVGYSYGGPIALASKKKYKKIVLLAPAVYSKVEPLPWALNMYKWKATRWLLPAVWKAASKEKLSHKEDLKNFENDWNFTPSNIISIHGTEDWIVPFENSEYLNKIFSSKQFELVTLNDAGHGLVWTHFKEIKNSILQQLN
jgi:pimeloyl-ACP methyl ester carboxylesterase